MLLKDCLQKSQFTLNLSYKYLIDRHPWLQCIQIQTKAIISLFSEDRYDSLNGNYNNRIEYSYGINRERGDCFPRDMWFPSVSKHKENRDDGTEYRAAVFTSDAAIPLLPPYVRFHSVKMNLRELNTEMGHSIDAEEISKIHRPLWEKLRSAIKGSTLSISLSVGSGLFPTEDKILGFIAQIDNCFDGYSLKVLHQYRYRTEIDTSSFIASLLQLTPIYKCAEVHVEIFKPTGRRLWYEIEIPVWLEVEILAPVESITNWLNSSDCEVERIRNQQIKERKLTIRARNIEELVDQIKKV